MGESGSNSRGECTIVCECLKVEETLIAVGQLLPTENEITDDFRDIEFKYCPVCGSKLSDK